MWRVAKMVNMEAKAAIDAAADTIAAQHLKSTGPLTVLRQLSGRLEPSEAPDNDGTGLAMTGGEVGVGQVGGQSAPGTVGVA
jgi:hypothetical protein